MDSDWVLIVPGKEGHKVAAGLLLQLAASPRDVRTDGNGLEFRVPPYLAELYNLNEVPAPAPAPVRRTRRKKEVTDGD